MRAIDDTVHRHGSSGSMVEGPTGIVDGRRSHGCVVDRPACRLVHGTARCLFQGTAGRLVHRRSSRVLLVKTVLEHAGDVLDGPAPVIVHPAEVVVVHVAGVIFEPAWMFYGAHCVVLDVAPHWAGGHRGRRGCLRMIYHRGSRLLGANLFHRPGHRLQRPARLMMFDGGSHRIGGRLPYHGVHRSHGLHRAHRLGRAHAVLDRPHRRRLGRSTRSAPASRYRVRTVAPATTDISTGGDTMTLRRPADPVRIHFHRLGDDQGGKTAGNALRRLSR